MTTTAEKIVETVRRLAIDVVSPLGLEIVDIVYRGQGKHSVLRIDIDRPGSPGVTLEDCERASRDIETAVDLAGLIEATYDLQVSSPGIDRPIVADDDIRRNTGRNVLVETVEPFQGSGEIRGTLLGAGDGTLEIRTFDGRVVAVPRPLVRVARQDADGDLHVAGKGARPRGKRDRRGIVGTPSS